MDGFEIPESVKRTMQTFILHATVVANYLWHLLCDFAQYAKFRSVKFYEAHLKKCEFVYRGVKITTDRSSVRPSFETICNAPKFLKWLDRFPLDKFDLKSILLTDVEFVGRFPTPNSVGLLKFNCDVYTKLGDPVDGSVVLRGNSGAVLIIVTDEDGKEYVILSQQPRVATGGYKEELITGTYEYINGNILLSDVMKKQLLDDLNIKVDNGGIEKKRLLGGYTLSGEFCDEMVHLAVWTATVNSDYTKTILYNQGADNESQMRAYLTSEFDKELSRIADAKTALAWLLHKNSQ